MPQEVKEAYFEALDVVGNPSSIHQLGQQARGHLEQARESIAHSLGCEPVEVILTSGGTEASNQALKGAVSAASGAQSELPSIVATEAEHHATLDTVEWLVTHQQAQWVKVPVDGNGVMDTDALQGALADYQPVLVSTLLANNEVGSVQPVAEIVGIAKERGVPVHLDAIAALGYIPVDFAALGVTAMSVSAHKVGGPHGVGALVVSRTAPTWEALLHGGDQQRLRSGTLDAPGAIAFAKALEVRARERVAGVDRLRTLRDRLREGLLQVAPQMVVRGHPTDRLPGNLHITVPGCDGDVLLYLLDERGIHVSTGSACQAGVPEASHVLLAMGVSKDDARGAVRFSLSYSTTEADVDSVITVFADVVEKGQAAGLS